MNISVEISYYPLAEDYNTPIAGFIEKLKSEDVLLVHGTMSTVLTGEYDTIMNLLNTSVKECMMQYPSVFHLKISNSCPVP